MALAQLLGRIEQEAAERRDAIHAAAETEAAAERVAGTRALTTDRRRCAARRKRVARERLGRFAAGEERETERAVLAARHALVERVREATNRRFTAALETEAYHALLPAHLAEAMQYLSGHVIIRCHPAIAEAIRTALTGSADVCIGADASELPGFTATGRNGELTVDQTLPSRLERIAPRLNVELIRRVEAT